METSHNDLLGELAADAALERSDFLIQATEQFRRFLGANGDRIKSLGGMTLIDEEPDYLSIAPDLTFRSRSRYLDDDTGEWVSETEVIESAAELVELYNPADLFQAFAESAREAAGLGRADRGRRPDGNGRDRARRDGRDQGADAYAGAADAWAAGRLDPEADDEESAARRLYDLALTFQERSQVSEARLIDQFEEAATRLTGLLGDLIIVDDDDERLTLEASGGFRAEVIPEDAEGAWRTLSTPRRSSSSTTRPMSSATSPRRSPRPTRRWRGRPKARPTTTRTSEDEDDGRRGGRRGDARRRRGRRGDGEPTRATPRGDDAARRGGAHREPGDPPGPVAAGVPCTGAGERLPGRPVRPCPDR